MRPPAPWTCSSGMTPRDLRARARSHAWAIAPVMVPRCRPGGAGQAAGRRAPPCVRTRMRRAPASSPDVASRMERTPVTGSDPRRRAASERDARLETPIPGHRIPVGRRRGTCSVEELDRARIGRHVDTGIDLARSTGWSGGVDHLHRPLSSASSAAATPFDTPAHPPRWGGRLPATLPDSSTSTPSALSNGS